MSKIDKSISAKGTKKPKSERTIAKKSAIYHYHYKKTGHYSFIGKNYDAEFQNIKLFEKFELLRYSHFFLHNNRSAEGLRAILSDLLKVDIEIQQAIATYEQIPLSQQCVLGLANTTLDEDLHLGDCILDRSSKFIIVLKNLSDTDFHRLLPNTLMYKKIQEMIS